MIRFTDGNLLEADVDALVNTVNTVGVMGKGIALQFKQAFPGNFKAYERACKDGEVQLGKIFVFDAGRLTRPHYIINFPTKKHWRSRSRLSDIDAGLKELAAVIADLRIKSIAVPPLGCGNGGLDWSQVRPRIEQALGGLTEVDVLVYPPQGAPSESRMPVRTTRPRMTAGRAALVGLVERYTAQAEDSAGVSQLELQKLMYFLQAAGENLRLRYVKGQYGPYADNLNHVLQQLEGHYLRGFGDRSRKVDAMAPLELLPGASDDAARFLESHPETLARFEAVLELIEGFESPYGLELLSTVHWVATVEDTTVTADVENAQRLVKKWSRRKARLFTDRHIAVAWDRLKTMGEWLGRSVVGTA